MTGYLSQYPVGYREAKTRIFFVTLYWLILFQGMMMGHSLFGAMATSGGPPPSAAAADNGDNGGGAEIEPIEIASSSDEEGDGEEGGDGEDNEEEAGSQVA